jgi:hypothetical protein
MATPTKVRRAVVLGLALLALVSPRLVAGETIADNARGFTLTLPDGFVPNPNLLAAAPNSIYAFTQGDLNDDKTDIFFVIERMPGTIGNQRMTLEHMPKGFARAPAHDALARLRRRHGRDSGAPR